MPPKRRHIDANDDESVEEDLNDAIEESGANWGKTKYDYYFTDYVDKDYPSSLNTKEERLARYEQEEALRLQKKLLSTLDNINHDIPIAEDGLPADGEKDDLLEFIENQNKAILAAKETKIKSIDGNKKKKVKFDSRPEPLGSDECEFDSEDDNDAASNYDDDDGEGEEESKQETQDGRKRRPINMAIRKNRGLTPYKKKKEYRNPRVKHKLKYKKALSKRRHLVKEAQCEYHRYSGEATGIKTSTVRSIKLC